MSVRTSLDGETTNNPVITKIMNEKKADKQDIIVKQLNGVKSISFDIIDDYSFNTFATGDNQEYFIYNGNYFEIDRKNQNWDRLPDLFSESTGLEKL